MSVVVAADFVAEAAMRLEAALRHGGSIALAGGSTPRPVYERLSLSWERLEVFFGDERAVPPDHPDSNFRMATAALRGKPRVHRMEAERADLAAAAAEYAVLLPPALDVLILGMGDDLHTASLFPGDPALESTARTAVVAMSPTAPRCPRITLTPPVITAAHEIFVLVSGAAKAGPLVTALRGEYDPRRFPVQLARHGTWIVDGAAAAQL